MDESNETKRLRGAPTEKAAGLLLARLGAKLSAPLVGLVSEIHGLDARGDDDATANLVELAHQLRAVVEPLTTLATLESRAPETEWTRIDVRSFLTEAMRAPDFAASFRLSPKSPLVLPGDELCLLQEPLTGDACRLWGYP